MHKRIFSKERSKDTYVSGRLASSCGQQRTSRVPNSTDCRVDKEVRFHYQPKEIRVSSCTGLYIPKLSIPFEAGDNLSNGRKMEKDSEEDFSNVNVKDYQCQRMAIGGGIVNFNREDCTFRNVAFETDTNRNVDAMVSILGGSEDTISSDRQSQGGIELVENLGQCDVRCTSQCLQTNMSNIHRCKSEGMGRASGWDRGVGTLDNGAEAVTYKCQGTVGSVDGVEGVSKFCEEQCGDDSNRQYNSCGIHQKAGWNKVCGNDGGHRAVVSVVGGQSDSVALQTCSRKVEHYSGQFIQGQGDCEHRVVNASRGVKDVVGSVGKTNDGYVCDQGEQQDAFVCIPSSGFTGNRDRRFVHGLDRKVHVHVSSNTNIRQGHGEDGQGTMFSGFDCASMAKAEVVSRTSGNVGGLSYKATGMGDVVEAAKVRDLSQSTRVVPVSRVEIVKQCHRSRGFSPEIAERMAKCQKESSISVYEGKWRVFSGWCDNRNTDPCQANVNDIAQFFLYLHTDRKLAYSTIEGYRTAISHTLKAVRGFDVGRDMDLSSLMANFARDRITRKSSVPEWDLSLVLYMLTKKPFEPMHVADLKEVTLKTVFLLALATGKRRSELHAMTSRVLHSEQWRSITLIPDVEFVAKTELGNRGSEVVKTVTVQSLTQHVCEDMQEDRSLCPVRAVKYYLKATEKLRKNRKKLFIAYKKGYNQEKEIHANTLSSWIKKVIMLAYESCSEEDKKLMKVKAHQVRSIAASWAFHKNISVDSIMSACSWKAHNTFTTYYLKDMALMDEQMYRLGPVVAAQQVVE